MHTLEYKKDPLYKAFADPSFIDVPNMQFVMVDGEGAPQSSNDTPTTFQIATQIVYGIVYAIKFWDTHHLKPAGYTSFNLAPLEALWWGSDQRFDMLHPETWKWTVMLRVPDFVSEDFFETVVTDRIDSKQSYIYSKARLEQFGEGSCVQLLHMGPYKLEGPDIERLHRYASEQGYALHDKHHELYFGDPRRTSPEKLRTILRQPVVKLLRN